MNDIKSVAPPDAISGPAQSALGGLTVLDLSDGVAGQFAARILADYGASTFLVEPEQGTSTRRMLPLRPEDGPLASFLFWHLNTGKRSLRIDWRSREGWADLVRRARHADVVVTEGQEELERLREVNPRMVLCRVTEFAPRGPYSDWKGSELIHQALAGVMYMSGRADREPLYGFGHRAYYSAGAAAAAAVLGLLIARERYGHADAASIDVHRTAASMSQNLVAQYDYNGSFPVRDRYPSGGCDVFPCLDGWLVTFIRVTQWTAFCEAFGAPEVGNAPEFAPQLLASNWPDAYRRISPFLAILPAAEVVRRALAVRVTMAPVLSLRQVLDCPHLAARGFWSSVPTGDRRRAVLGPMFRMSATPGGACAAAPLPGDGEGAAASGSTARASGVRSTELPPLAGMRILEISTAWAGPMAGRLLASLGAQMIKIESLAALDNWRGPLTGADPCLYPEATPGAKPYNRHVYFNSQNIGKLSLELNLKLPESRVALERIARRCDGVLCNLSTRASKSLGLDYGSLRALKQDAVLVEMPAAGEGGPMSGFLGNGPTMEALAGGTSLMGYDDGAPQRSGPAYVDPIGALHGVLGMLTALYHRARTGEGQRVEVAQREAAMHYWGEYLLACEETGRSPQLCGNALEGAAPHDAYRSRGEDEWVAIAVFSEDEWRALCEELGTPALAADERFLEASLRSANAQSLRSCIEERTRCRDKHELAQALQKRGVRAAPVCDGRDLNSDAQLAANGFALELDHPEAGRHRYHGTPYVFDAMRPPAPHAAPVLGQHTRQVLEELAGFTPAELERCLAANQTNRSVAHEL